MNYIPLHIHRYLYLYIFVILRMNCYFYVFQDILLLFWNKWLNYARFSLFSIYTIFWRNIHLQCKSGDRCFHLRRGTSEYTTNISRTRLIVFNVTFSRCIYETGRKRNSHDRDLSGIQRNKSVIAFIADSAYTMLSRGRCSASVLPRTSANRCYVNFAQNAKRRHYYNFQ